eukprot:scaffold7266_cov71-Cylindrotheca_fusiformis.AAC.3
MVWTINKALVIGVLLFTATTIIILCFVSTKETNNNKLGEQQQEQQRNNNNNKNRHELIARDQQQRHLSSSSPSLVLYGSDPRFRLRQCEGDCDKDSDCEEGNDDDLVCFQRGGPYEPVPGCMGGEMDGTLSDYCVHINDLTLPRLSWSLTFPLQQCQGDCDYDSDCQENLICFQRNELIPIPSCLGNDWSRTDYCILPPPPPPRRRKIGFPLWPFQDTASLPTITSPRPPTLRPTTRPPTLRPANAKTTSPPIPSPTSPPNNNNDNQHNTILRFGTTFPLGHCEGDCDANQDCQDGMVCFQRNNNVMVPGCQGGHNDGTLTDYCIFKDDFPNLSSYYTGNNRIISNVRLKLYWQRGYTWQEETFERKWCIFCMGSGGRFCREHRRLYIHTCQSSSQHFDIIPQWGDYYVIKLHDDDLCLQRQHSTSNTIHTITCDGSNELQLWFARNINGNGNNNNKNFAGSSFEISPLGDKDLCVTQRHHPKYGEAIKLEPCTIARRDQTSQWNRY